MFDQGVRSPGILVGDIAGNDEYLSILFQSAARCDPGAAVFVGFQHENADRNAADDATANGKVLRCGKCVHGKFRDQGAAQGQHLLREPGVFLGINNVHSSAGNRHRFPSGVDGAAMGGGVYAASQAAKNDQPADGEVARQALAIPSP